MWNWDASSGSTVRWLAVLPWICGLSAVLFNSISHAEDIAADIKEQADQLKQQQLEVAQQLVGDFPQDFSAVQTLANVYKMQGNSQAFLRCLQQCAQLDPKRSDVYEQLGMQTLALEDYDAAIRHFRKSLAIRAKVGVAVRLADALHQIGETEEAKQILTSTANRDTSGKASYLLGELSFQHGELAAAKAAYEQALQHQPNHLNASYGMVKVLTQLGDVEAVDHYSKKFERVRAAVAELNQRKRNTYDDLTELRRNTGQTLTDAGRVYHGRRQISTAERLWRQAETTDPSNIACRILLARHYEATKQPASAAVRYRALIRLQPKNLANYERLGIRLASDGDFDGAEQVFTSMTKVPPNPSRGYRMLAKLYLNSDRQLKKALQLAKQSVDQDPVADSHFVYGWALAKNGQPSAAKAALRKAMELDESNKLYQKLYRSLP